MAAPPMPPPLAIHPPPSEPFWDPALVGTSRSQHPTHLSIFIQSPGMWVVMPWGWAEPPLDAEPQLEGGLGGKMVRPHCQQSDVKCLPSRLLDKACDPGGSVSLLWECFFYLMTIQQ